MNLEDSPKSTRMLAAFGRRSWFWLVAALAVANGIFALRYLLPHPPFAADLPNVRLMPIALTIHATCAGLALCLGPMQFVPRCRVGRLHAQIGTAYVVLVVIGWAASVAIAFTAFTGAVAAAGFLSLGIVWIATTALGYTAARRRAYRDHGRFMLWSYACAAAAITLRLQLAFVIGFNLDSATYYPTIAWSCWIPNLIAVAIFLRINPAWPARPRHPSRSTP